jgi:hypothetical protein
MLQYKNVYKIKPSKRKLEGNKAYKRKDYPTAAKLYSLVNCCTIILLNFYLYGYIIVNLE